MQIGLGVDFGEQAVELGAAVFAHGIGVLAADVGADFGNRFVGFHPAFVEPVDRRLALFGGDDFDALAVFQRGGQRHDLAFDFRAATAVADAAVQA